MEEIMIGNDNKKEIIKIKGGLIDVFIYIIRIY